MERVKNVLQRLQELYYSKHQKSAIDVDLMLDYTRVMYADLLEWRRTFKDESPVAEEAEVNTPQTSAAEPAAPATAPPAAEAEQTAPPAEEQEASAPEQQDPVAEAAAPEVPADGTSPTAEDAEAAKPQDKAYQPVERDEPEARPEPEVTTTPVIKSEPEKEYLNNLQQDASGISFEPPSAPEVKSELKEELLIEEPAVNPVVEEIPVPAPAEIPLPEPLPAGAATAQAPQANLFSAAKMPRDIRNAIGINDKYLFLNELFNNHKSDYEETLDQLNHFSTIEQAEDWIRTKVAAARRWDKEDATVTSFYAILKRHFSER